MSLDDVMTVGRGDQPQVHAHLAKRSPSVRAAARLDAQHRAMLRAATTYHVFTLTQARAELVPLLKWGYFVTHRNPQCINTMP